MPPNFKELYDTEVKKRLPVDMLSTPPPPTPPSPPIAPIAPIASAPISSTSAPVASIYPPARSFDFTVNQPNPSTIGSVEKKDEKKDEKKPDENLKKDEKKPSLAGNGIKPSELLQFGNGLLNALQQGGMYNENNRQEVPSIHIQPIDPYKQLIPFQFGNGKPLYTDDIDKIMARYKDYVGTIARDQIKHIASNVKPRSRVAFVMNTDPSTKKGEHWVSIYVDARPNGSNSVEYYDSFADPCPPDVLKSLKHLVERMKPDSFLKFKENRVRHQSASTSNCGYFASRFLIDRFRNKSFSEATGFSDKIQNAVKENEAEIEKLKNLPPFNYINDLDKEA
jgi:hypothetical protein